LIRKRNAFISGEVFDLQLKKRMKVEFGCHRSWVELRRSSAFKKLEGHKNEIDPANAGMFRFQEEDRDNCWCKMICNIHITKAEGFCGKLFREIGDGCRFEEVGTKITMGKWQLGLHPKLVPKYLETP
jgi:hypothetical protein